jgi:hypothetical protein
MIFMVRSTAASMDASSHLPPSPEPCCSPAAAPPLNPGPASRLKLPGLTAPKPSLLLLLQVGLTGLLPPLQPSLPPAAGGRPPPLAPPAPRRLPDGCA